MLIMDQKVTTHAVLGELDGRGVTFLTLRMRSPALMKYINALDRTTSPPSRWTGPAGSTGRGAPGHRNPAHRLPRHRASTRRHRARPRRTHGDHHQRPAPAGKALIEHYARRMTIEQRLAEIIQAFHADALSSAVNLNVDLDIMLCVLAQALIAALRARLPGYATVTPDVLQRRFLETPGTITTSADTITVRLDRRAYSPVLRQADLPTTPSPLVGKPNPTLRIRLKIASNLLRGNPR